VGRAIKIFLIFKIINALETRLETRFAAVSHLPNGTPFGK
jgi:hypothetical protein